VVSEPRGGWKNDWNAEVSHSVQYIRRHANLCGGNLRMMAHIRTHTLKPSNRDIFFTNRALCATSSVKMSIANGIYSVQNAVRTTKCMKIISCVCVCVRSFCRGKETLCTDVWFVHVMSAVVSRHEI